jgi:hypothetical protein
MSYHHHNGNLSGGIVLTFVGCAILATAILGIDSSLVWKIFAGALLIVLGIIKLLNIGSRDE